ncbi:hypothetical protein QNH00_gp02 [Yersinia phage PYps16N]|uniref:Uncharacterized protein n=1 Tax=Yersinia phage PYps16N TaxID=2801354 RepID=A0AAE7TQG5_9CAUD|nr:hypothetical protein QNH00_gp02 [Yersinia phage PYps16N]QQO91175.1 hypothetical protein ORF002 [Yersinia phage PYps16N]
MNMLNCNEFICQIDEFSHNQTCTINYRFTPTLNVFGTLRLEQAGTENRPFNTKLQK